MKKCQDLPTRVHRRIEVIDNGRDERLRKVVESRPKKNRIERSSRELKSVVEIRGNVPDRVFVLIFAGHPVSCQRFVYRVAKKDAVPKISEVVDIVGRRGSGVDHAQTWLGLETFAQRHPSPGIPGILRTSRPVGRGIVLGFLLEETPDHSKIPCRGDTECTEPACQLNRGGSRIVS